MQVSVSRQLLEKVPEDPQGSDLASYPVVGLVPQVRDMERFPHALCFKSLDPFLRVSKQGSCFTTVEENGGDKRLEGFERSHKAHGVAPPDPV